MNVKTADLSVWGCDGAATPMGQWLGFVRLSQLLESC